MTCEIDSLEEMLKQLAKHGEVMLWNTKMLRTTSGLPGWMCKVELFSPHEGVSAEVKSNGRHPDPHAAVTECLTRLQLLLESDAITPPAHSPSLTLSSKKV